MRQILSSFLCLHWAAAFAILAFVCIGGLDGVEAALAMAGMPANDRLGGLAGAGLTIPLAVALLLVAVLFCWASVELFIGDADRPHGTESVVKAAFVGAGLLVSAMLIAGTAAGIDGVFPAVATQITALAACYLTCVGERLGNARHAVRSNSSRDAAHIMAAGAARIYTLHRSTGLPNREGR